jgi:hypothetical protein
MEVSPEAPRLPAGVLLWLTTLDMGMVDVVLALPSNPAIVMDSIASSGLPLRGVKLVGSGHTRFEMVHQTDRVWWTMARYMTLKLNDCPYDPEDPPTAPDSMAL